MKFKPQVKAAVTAALEALHAERTATAQEVEETLTKILRGEMSEQVLAFTGNGIQNLTDKPAALKERLKAAELLGRRHGMFESKVNISGVVPVIIKDDL